MSRVDWESLVEHEAASLFPIMPKADIAALADDIRANGQRHPIILSFADGRPVILDGRNRVLACRMVPVEPKWREWEGGDAVAFVLSENLHRRHLSESQRSMVAARIAKLGHGVNQHAPIGASSPSQSEAGKMLNVSRRNVQRARVVLESGSPETIAAVERGEIAVSAAAKSLRAESAPPAPIVARPTPVPTPRASPAPNARSVDHAKRSADVKRLHDEGRGTTEIAEMLGIHSSAVSDVKLALGISVTSPGVKLWKDIEHLSVTLAGASSQVEKLAGMVAGTLLSATQEEIESCIKRLSQITSSVRHLSSSLRSLTRTSINGSDHPRSS